MSYLPLEILNTSKARKSLCYHVLNKFYWDWRHTITCIICQNIINDSVHIPVIKDDTLNCAASCCGSCFKEGLKHSSTFHSIDSMRNKVVHWIELSRNQLDSTSIEHLQNCKQVTGNSKMRRTLEKLIKTLSATVLQFDFN